MRVGEGVDAVDRIADQCCGPGRDPLGGACDAADGRQDPDLVARADAAIGANIALERPLGLGGGRGGGGRWIDRIEPIG